jgi:hypothetical protein
VNQPATFNDPWTAYPGGNPFPTPMPPPANIAFPQQGTYVTMPLHLDPMRVTQWNVSYQRQFATSWMASVAYLGNKTENIWIGKELNPGVYIPGGSTQGNLEQRRTLTLMNPQQGVFYSGIQESFEGWGHYNGLMLGLQKRLSGGWSTNTNVTISKCLNNGEPGTDITNVFPDPEDPSTNWGPCDPDRFLLVNSGFIYLTQGMGSGFVRGLTRDWQFGTVFQARSGTPLTPATTGNLSLTGLGNQRPFVVGDPELEDRTAARWFNTAAFAPNTPGNWGDTPRGFLRGPAYWNFDLAVSRMIRMGGEQRLELRVEAFNLTNRVHLGNPNVTLGNANFGRIISTDGDARVMQFAVKYGF